MSDEGPTDGPAEGPVEELASEVGDIIERGLSEVETVADNYYHNIRDRIHAIIPGKETFGNRRRGDKNNDPIEDETGHATWDNRRSSNLSHDSNDEEESEDDRHTSERSVRSSETQSPDGQITKRLRIRDWDADDPPQERHRICWRDDPYARPRRRSLQALQYRPPLNPPYMRTPPPPYRSTYDSRTMYRSRSLTPPPRRRNRSDSNRYKRETIKENIKPLAAGAVGFVAGGFIGHTAGKGDKAVTAAGAVLGAIGGHEIGKEWERHKERKEKDKRRRRD